MEYISGIVERITYTNEENGFCVLKLKAKGFSGLVTAVGNLAAVNVGTLLRLKGEWKQDSKYGWQFSVVDYRETVPATIAGLEKYLGSGLIKGIGPVNARRIVRQFKENTLQVIEETPEELDQVEGIGPKRVEMIKKAWQEQKEIKNVMLFLQSSGVSTAHAVKIFKTYGDESIDTVKENPYRLADDIWGIGFKTADQIAQQLGFDKTSYARCRSAVMYMLGEFSNQGHCYVEKEALISETARMLELEEDLIEQTLKQMLPEGAVIQEGEDAVYLPPFYYSEVGTALRIAAIHAGTPKALPAKLQGALRSLQKQQNMQYDPVQKEAIQSAAYSKFMILTGGPGTGKTTITLAIIQIFRKMGRRVLLAAPTGRAAKKLSETTGTEAKTIHRLLEYKPTKGYQKNAENQLPCDVLILDEASMVDIVLMYNLLKAVPDEAVVLLVGDVDQLPSVGAGNVLKDIIGSGTVPVIQLTKIFRQALGSAIITNAHRINQGQMPRLKSGRGSDFFFIEENDPSTVAETIKSLCTKRLPSYYKADPLRDIQVLSPMQRGETGAQNLNALLQESLNPSKVTIRYGGTVYRQNDKVMQIKNNYDKSVFNGDIGVITRINEEDRTLTINFDSNEVEYDATELDEVVLAYACTVHKSQGSEYPIVVAPLTIQHYMMLQKNLLYTCVTRAKKVFVLVGTKKAIGITVSNDKIQQRNTMLAKRLQEYCAKQRGEVGHGKQV